MAFKCYFSARTVLVCSLLLVLCNAVPAPRGFHHRLQKRSSVRLCGKMLVEALAAICMNEYYVPSHIKRNYAYYSEIDPDWDDSDVESLLEPQSALDFFSYSQLDRNGRGIADECCRMSCNYRQLLSYCGNSPEK